MAQYPIPQFIEEEGKIIFFLTFRQFFLLVGGGAFCMLLYFILPFSLFVICAILVTVLVLVIAFFKVNNASVVTLALNFLGFVTGAKNYTWKRRELLHPVTLQKYSQPKPTQEIPMARIQASKLKDAKRMVELNKK